MPAQAAVEVRDLTKKFVRRDGSRRRGKKTWATALDHVSFRIERGECVAILGQNGSGKSTLVRLLSTLLINDGGTAEIFGVDVFAHPRQVQRMVNRVSVEASFFKRMSPLENLSYSARFYGLGIKETRTRIPEILERVGFPVDRATEPMEDLSRGMQQKIALARALLTSPMLLLLDEPTTGLDPRSKREVQAFVESIRETNEVTTLLCSHDMVEAGAMADRVGILHNGRLLCLEPTAGILARYEADDLEGAFLAATGRTFEDEHEEEVARR